MNSPAARREARGRRACRDAAALLLMARHNLQRIRAGEQPNDREAAREAIRVLGLRDANVTDGAIEDRLRRKFRAERELLMAAAEDAEDICPNLSQAKISSATYELRHKSGEANDRGTQSSTRGFNNSSSAETR